MSKPKIYEVTVTFLVEVPEGEVLTQGAIAREMQDLLHQAPEFFHPENVLEVQEVQE